MSELPTVVMRPLKPGDGAFLCSIFKDNPEYYNIFFDPEDDPCQWEQRVNRFLGQDDICHYIIEAEHIPVGWLSCFESSPEERELGILVVKKEYLHCGYGKQALLWCIRNCRQAQVRRLLLCVNKNNVRAIRFYRQFGFRIVAEECIPQCNDAIDLWQYHMQLDLA